MDKSEEMPNKFYCSESSEDSDDIERDESDVESRSDESFYERVFSSDEDEDEDEDISASARNRWKTVTSNSSISQMIIPQTFKEGVQNLNLSSTDHPIKFYELFITEEVIQLLTDQTNLYASQILTSQTNKKISLLNQWENTYPQEMRKFLGLLLYMGFSALPLRDYWCKGMFSNKIVPNIMSRKRFKMLLSMWHFSNNEEADGDRLHKIKFLKNKLEALYQNYNIPGKYLCVYQTMVPFREHFLHRGRRYKTDVKVMKISDNSGYTYGIHIYEGEDEEENTADIALKLCEKYLDEGRVAATDYYCSSVELTERLLSRNTHVIGIMGNNRKHVPKEVFNKKIRKNHVTGMYDEKGIVVIKWHDRYQGSVPALSTTHTAEITSTEKKTRKGEPILLPQMLQDYNTGTTGIELSEQYLSSAMGKSVKWYRKVAMELILGTTVLNAHILYKTITNQNMSIIKFKQKLYTSLLGLKESTNKQLI